MFLLIPSTILKKRNIGYIKPAYNLIISTVFIISFFSFQMSIKTNFNFCIIKKLMDFPCPGCGITRGMNYFFQFEFHNSFYSNPCSIIIGLGIIVTVVLAILNIIWSKRFSENLFLKSIRYCNIFLAVLLSLNYLITIFNYKFYGSSFMS